MQNNSGRCRTVVIGNGLLGKEVAQTINGTLLTRKDVDVIDPQSIANCDTLIQAETVINCTAFANVEACERNIEEAFSVNAIGPKNLSRSCQKTGARLIHVSTDFVFDGAKNGPYTELDIAKPLCIYGKSKLAGELEIIKNHDDYLIIRTAWLFGPSKTNFVEKIILNAQKLGRVEVVDDQIGSPTYTVDLARNIEILAQSTETGIVNCTNANNASWYDLSKTAIKYAGIKAEVIPIKTDYAVEKFRLKAARPANSELDLSKVRDILPEGTIRPWEIALSEYIEGIK